MDMHSHSTASDGSLRPAELAAAAAEAGLAGLALTDHDTVDGLAEFLAAGRELGFPVLGGVEISLEHSGTMHMLGYDLSGGPEVPAALNRLKSFRRERNLKMLDLLDSLGYHLSWDRLQELSGGGQLGRPHFAALLLEKGYFQSREEIFDKLIGKGRPGYVDKIRLSPEEGLAMIREAGWAPVLAHPVSLNLEPRDYPAALARLAEAGLAGLEVIHPNHSLDQVDFFKKMARDLDLVATAGSDFHGKAKPNIGLDWVRSAAAPGWEMVDRLRDRLDSRPSRP
jgi:Predicted metal-dependent phosphoesterases (PHP family)